MEQPERSVGGEPPTGASVSKCGRKNKGKKEHTREEHARKKGSSQPSQRVVFDFLPRFSCIWAWLFFFLLRLLSLCFFQLRDCDLAVEGSPTVQILISPRSRIPCTAAPLILSSSSSAPCSCPSPFIPSYFKNCDLAVEGSPTMQLLISPRSRIPSGVVLGTPPNSINKIPRLISRWPRRRSENKRREEKEKRKKTENPMKRFGDLCQLR